MTSASEIQPPLGLGSGIEALRAKRGWIIALGIIYVIAGLIALGSVVMATVVSVFVVGIMMLIAGVAEVINAFQVKSWGKFLFWLLLGGLYIVAGFVAFENPLLAAAVLTLILGVALVASGIMRIILAFSMKALGGPVQRDHAASGPCDPCALACLKPLHSRAFPRDRSDLGGSWLDQRWLGPKSPHMIVQLPALRELPSPWATRVRQRSTCRHSLIHEGPGLRSLQIAGFDGIDFEPGAADQVIHLAIEVTAPTDTLPVWRQPMLPASSPDFR
jgi:uncharacterized membrane protein HdeD (DUF308 family)